MYKTIEYGEPYVYRGDEAVVTITPVKAKKEGVKLITEENFERIWRGFVEGEYTYVRLIVMGKIYDYVALRPGNGNFVLFQNASESAPMRYIHRDELKKLVEKMKVYAVRKAKKGEAQWHIEIKYRNKKVVFGMIFAKHKNALEKRTSSGKIGVIVYENGEGKEAWLDINKLIDAKLGRAVCDNCLEKWLVEALNDIKDPNFNWNITRHALQIKLGNININ